MTTISAKPTFDDTLGAALLGGIAASILYGITCVQTFIFLKGSQANRTNLRIIVISLWIIDTFQHILVIHALYYYMVTNYGNPQALENSVWSIVAQLIPGAISDTLVRSVYASRIWRLTHRVPYIAIIGILCLNYFGTKFGECSIFTSAGIQLNKRRVCTGMAVYLLAGHLQFEQVNKLSWLLYSGLSSAVVVDAFIAIVLSCTIYQQRTGFKNTNEMLKKLILLAINTGVLMTFGSMSVFIAYVARPHSLIYIGAYMPTNKIYINSLLASLNAREYVRGSNNVITDSVMPTFDNEGSIDSSALSSFNKSSNSKDLKSSGIPQANFTSSTVYASREILTKIDVKS
ncbi:hypothetical protein BDQ12DRAFT_308038 [Crucibulum laeve]|uniref:DUF6534 domain-containing protein n=1 Tax=Crucibulum laeve TaxID=68775 RepID=A0A5C3LDK9_9AGAR|nr:hypothetical protein BDQ12DRAFT_308038 [Crucibulum laeve]